MQKIEPRVAEAATDDSSGFEAQSRRLEHVVELETPRPIGREATILPLEASLAGARRTEAPKPVTPSRQAVTPSPKPVTPSPEPVTSVPVSSVARKGAWRVVSGTISTMAGITLALVAVLAVVVAVSSHLSGSGQLGIAGHPVLIVLSGSMAPVINTGDLVVDNKLTPAQAAGLHVGQVVSFRAGTGSSKIFTHRIAGIETLPGGGVGYVTKGDANDSRDGPVTSSSNVVGLYQSKIPDGGYVLDALHRPLVLGLLLASPILWLLAEPLWIWARQADEPEIGPATKGDPSSQ